MSTRENIRLIARAPLLDLYSINTFPLFYYNQGSNLTRHTYVPA